MWAARSRISSRSPPTTLSWTTPKQSSRIQTPLEREIQGQSGHWFVRRIMPYRASDDKTEGVVITYEDVTERRRTAEALSAA